MVDGSVIDMPGGYARGLNVALLDRNGLRSSRPRSSIHTATSGAADAFAALIEGTPEGQVVAIAVQDEAWQRLNDRAKRACRAIGSALIDQLGYRGSWAIVGAKGRAMGTAAEMVANSAPAYSGSRVMGRPESALRVWIGAQSAGLNVGNAATIPLNGMPVQSHGWHRPWSQCGRLDEATGSLLAAHTYDTHGSAQAADAFADMIERLPPGRLAAIAVQDSHAIPNSPRASSVWPGGKHADHPPGLPRLLGAHRDERRSARLRAGNGREYSAGWYPDVDGLLLQLIASVRRSPPRLGGSPSWWWVPSCVWW